jgi:hypothetical protein
MEINWVGDLGLEEEVKHNLQGLVLDGEDIEQTTVLLHQSKHVVHHKLAVSQPLEGIDNVVVSEEIEGDLVLDLGEFSRIVHLHNPVLEVDVLSSEGLRHKVGTIAFLDVLLGGFEVDLKGDISDFNSFELVLLNVEVLAIGFDLLRGSEVDEVIILGPFLRVLEDNGSEDGLAFGGQLSVKVTDVEDDVEGDVKDGLLELGELDLAFVGSLIKE